jgi:hypothetical protein
MRYQDRPFRRLLLNDLQGGAVLDDFELHRCEIDGCGIYLSRDHSPSVIQRVMVSRCELVSGCSLENTIIEDTTLEHLKVESRATIDLRACAFRHVIIRGRLPRLIITMTVDSSPYRVVKESAIKAIEDVMTRYYDTVDWALDIREAEFHEELALLSVPGHLVRRDPDRQMSVSREAAMRAPLRSFQFENPHTMPMLERIAGGGSPTAVFVGPARGKRAQGFLRDFAVLREHGIAT